jgi:dTDP-4-dehydrorhamnose reductase
MLFDKKIVVFGCSGMLGSYVVDFLRQEGYRHVRGFDRSCFDFSKVSVTDLVDAIGCIGGVVINCAGLVKSRAGQLKPFEFIRVNSVFPWLLSDACKECNSELIHVSTDCVFSGKLYGGGYCEYDLGDCTDLYGRSKYAGEPEDCSVIRTSIIGEERNTCRGLLEWSKCQTGKHIEGYLNHFWNGVTCLQFAKICSKIIKDNCFWSGVRHIFSPDTVSKAALLKIIDFVYNLDLKINNIFYKDCCYRNLNTVYNWPGKSCDFFNIPTIKEQIVELKYFGVGEK